MSLSKLRTMETLRKQWRLSRQRRWYCQERQISIFRESITQNLETFMTVKNCFRRPEDSEYEIACMQPGVGKLDVFPSIWGRKYPRPVRFWNVHFRLTHFRLGRWPWRQQRGCRMVGHTAISVLCCEQVGCDKLIAGCWKRSNMCCESVRYG